MEGMGNDRLVGGNEKDVIYGDNDNDRLIGNGNNDALIGEPILGTRGIVPPPAGFWVAIQAVLKKHGILMIAVEVVTGFGRLGTMFGADYCGIKAGIITIAKGLASAYAPLSGSIVSGKVWIVLEQGTDENGPIGHGWTYSAHPIGAAAGMANLNLIDDLKLIDNAGEVGSYLNKTMADALGDHLQVGDVRGEGMLCAVEFAKDKDSGTLYDAAGKVGPQISAKMMEQSSVIASAMPQDDNLGFAPPFCLSKSEVETVVGAAVQTVKTGLG